MNFLNTIKYKFVRYLESNPFFVLFIYHNINLFKIFLPHEKDYHGIKLILKNDLNYSILDVGGNLGISSMGFRKLGFRNRIFIFEPNYFIFNKFITRKLLIKYKNIKAYNIALGASNKNKNFYMPQINNKPIHYLASFDKAYIKNSIKLLFKNCLKKIKITKKKIKLIKLDDLNIKNKIKFVKIDVEGYDHKVIMGMKKIISKDKPVFLIEFNKSNFFLIKRLLKNYQPYKYIYKFNKLEKFSSKDIDISVSRSLSSNLLSIRNIFFIPNKNN